MPPYDHLAAELRRTLEQFGAGAHYWIGLAGAPGSGKSTLAAALTERMAGLLTVIPMDGYHYYRHELDAMAEPKSAYARRGAPFTFNAHRFVMELIQARQSDTGTFPSYDHHVGDPVENAIILRDSPSQIVLVEGNYLLLDEEPWCQLRDRVFHEAWFLDVPVQECNRRTFQRHLTTGLTTEAAQKRIDTNDSLNAELVTKVSPKRAGRLIRVG